MIHSFEVEIAVEYGIEAAIILQNLAYWIKHNEANGVNYFDGNYWTYNSRDAFHRIFPYMSLKSIRTALKKLEDSGIIITGNYNKLTYDRTLWYALTEKGKCICRFGQMDVSQTANGIAKMGKSNCLFGQMELPEMANRISQNGKPIPDIKPNVNSDLNEDSKTNKKAKSQKPKIDSYDSMIAAFTENLELRDALSEFVKMRFMINKPLTERAMKMILNKLEKFAQDDATQIAIVNQSILHNWQDVYELKANNTASGWKQGNQNSQYIPNTQQTEDDYDWNKVIYGG